MENRLYFTCDTRERDLYGLRRSINRLIAAQESADAHGLKVETGLDDGERILTIHLPSSELKVFVENLSSLLPCELSDRQHEKIKKILADPHMENAPSDFGYAFDADQDGFIVRGTVCNASQKLADDFSYFYFAKTERLFARGEGIRIGTLDVFDKSSLDLAEDLGEKYDFIVEDMTDEFFQEPGPLR